MRETRVVGLGEGKQVGLFKKGYIRIHNMPPETSHNWVEHLNVRNGAIDSQLRRSTDTNTQ